jgi:predicted RNA binding protein YcfA (HicA-like mRNA interferase family)
VLVLAELAPGGHRGREDGLVPRAPGGMHQKGTGHVSRALVHSAQGLTRRRLHIVESSALVTTFPSMKAGRFLAVLTREPLGYKITRQRGSHRKLEAAGRPVLLWSYHDSATVPPGVIRKYLVNLVGLTESEAMTLLKGR